MHHLLRLGVNIDHVATLRNARGGGHPCPVRGALEALKAGADGITAHLREDRRHIQDRDMERLKAEVPLPLNFEMAATEEMRQIALRIRPNAVCLVPEKREELTTEGGLDAQRLLERLRGFIAPLKEAGIRISLFIDPVAEQIDAAAKAGADIVELHTGEYAREWERAGEDGAFPRARLKQLASLLFGASHAAGLGLEVHAGHGLNFANVAPVAAIPEIVELNIGHFLIGEAVFSSLDEAVREMRRRMDAGRAGAAA